MNKLKPCPFCGSEDLRSVQLYESNDEHYIACNECNSHGEDGLTLLHAIKNWNKRAKQHCTQCESKKENPWCSNCREKNCVVSSDGTCEMIRRYLKPRCVHCKVSEQNLDLIAEVERLKGENEIPKCPGKDVCRTRSGSCFNCIRSIGDLKGYTDNYREKVTK